MSLRITLSIPTPLAERIEERRGDETVQDYVLAALRAVARYVRVLGGAQGTTAASLAVPAPSAEADMWKVW